MTKPVRRTYEFTPEDKRILAGASLLPRCVERSELLMKYFDDEIKDSIKFADVVGSLLDMMEVIQENTKEIVEMVAIEHFDVMPDRIPPFNLPTILGAFNGYELSRDVDQSKLCDGCAFKKGTAANTCLTTVHDCRIQADNSEMFWCHKDLNDDGTPSAKCRGFLKKRKQEK